MKEEWRIVSDKDYRRSYIIQYMNDRYYVSVDPYESASERKARLIRENRDNKINQVLG